MTGNKTTWKINRTDVIVATATAAAVMLLSSIAIEEGSTPPDAVAYSLAAMVGAVLLWRRRYPIGVAVASLVIVLVYHALGFTAIGNLPLAVALFNVSYYSATMPAVVVGSIAVAGTFTWFLVGESRVPPEALNFVVHETGVLATVILLGAVLRSRQQLAEETRERLRAVRADQEAQSARRHAEERMGIAREIHDIIAHTVAVIGVQAKVALETLHESPSQAEDALRIIDESTRDASMELRATVGVLRSEPSLSPAPGLAQVPDLVESVSTGDLEVTMTETGEPYEVSGLTGLIAYRVVQEALTNVVRHANASKAVVEIGHNGDLLRVTVSDDGSGGRPDEGYGIAGMRERVEAVGGTLSIGESELGGLCVDATIPTREPR